MIKYFVPIVSLVLLLNYDISKPKRFYSHNKLFMYNGRYEFLQNDVALISPGATVSINFSGNFCKVYLEAQNQPYNYVSIELDGKYQGRIKVYSGSAKAYDIKVLTKEKIHSLKIVKDSEASNGAILFNSIEVENISEIKPRKKPYIEFIGDSVTCGAAADDSVVPCNSGNYFDHTNVYYSYGLSLARILNADFTLSSVSGIGMYRNWNDENVEEPIMPQVYENLYLDTDNSKKYHFDEEPDIVSICLGTNDLSKGDGGKPRLSFNKEKFTKNYIDFIKTVYKHYSETQIVLLNSPMIVGKDNEILVSCLKEVQNHFTKDHGKSILLFEFEKQFTSGCSYHPSVKEHQEIAKKLMPFFKGILNKQ